MFCEIISSSSGRDFANAWFASSHAQEAPPGAPFRVVTITGDSHQVAYCQQLLLQKITSREDGGMAGPITSPPPFDSNSIIVQVPDEHVGRVIGKSGAHIRDMQVC